MPKTRKSHPPCLNAKVEGGGSDKIQLTYLPSTQPSATTAAPPNADAPAPTKPTGPEQTNALRENAGTRTSRRCPGRAQYQQAGKDIGDDPAVKWCHSPKLEQPPAGKPKLGGASPRIYIPRTKIADLRDCR
jgi:hypothetical protein